MKSPGGVRVGARATLALAAVVALYWLVATVLCRQAGAVRSFDLVNYYLPLYQVTFAKLASGSLPLWNPYHLAGIPWLATLQAGIFYPPRWLYAILPPNLALASSHALHLVLIAVCMAAFARKVGLCLPAALWAALPFSLRGTTWWWLQFPSVLEAGAWLPLGALAVLGIARGEGRRPVALLAFAMGMSLLAGYTQASVFCVTAWGTLLLALLAAGGVGPGSARRGATALALFAGAIALGAMLGAVQVWPTFELTLEGTRTTEALTRIQAQTVGGKASYLLGQALIGSHMSLGATLLGLAPAALALRRHRALSVWALLLAGVSYALAVGTSTWLVEVYRALPVLGWFRNPRRLLFLTNFGLSLVAAITVDGLLRRAPGARLAGALSAGCALALGAWAWSQGERAMAGLALGLALAAGASVAPGPGPATDTGEGRGWVGGGRAGRWAGALAAVWIALAVGDAALERSERGPLPYDRASAASYQRSAALFRQIAAALGPDRATWIGPRRDRELKLAAAYGVRWLDDYEPLNLRRHSEYFSYLQHGTPRLWNARGSFAGVILPQSLKPGTVPHWLEIAGRRRLLDLASTRGFVIGGQLVDRDGARAFIASAGLTPGRELDRGWVLFENPHALPRACVTYRAEPAPPTDELLHRLAEPDFDPMVVSWVEADGPLPRSSRRGHPARITRDGETQVEIEAELAEPGLVVLGDSYMRGWRATVDGRAAPIYPTNHLFRGVPVPAGRHRVRFEYRPLSVTAGAGLSLSGGALCAVLAFARRSRADRS